MPRMNELSSYATTIASNGDEMVVTYHRTQIVRWDRDTVTLNMGGYDTVTTRRKMNQTANQFGLGYNVFRKDFETFVRCPDGETRSMPSHTGMVLSRHAS